MWNGKLKAVTFSLDDGVTQDKRAIDILNKYNLKATFNLNSSFFGLKGELDRNNHIIRHDKVHACDVAEIYKGHEVAAHTLTHPMLPQEDDKTIIWQVEEDRKVLSALVGYNVTGMAYPGGGVNNDERVAKIIKENTNIKFARTIESTHNFDLQTNLYRFNPTVYFIEEKKLFELAEKFINLKTDEPKIFYIWGHTYEMDAEYISWERFEEFCKLISNRDDIFYGTNSEILLK